MENLAPVINPNDIPTKQYVDNKAAGGFYAISGRWGAAWPSAKSAVPIILSPYWIYAYRMIDAVSIQSVGIENPGPGQGQPLKIVAYSDVSGWPGTKYVEAAITTDLLGMNICSLSIGTGSYWLAIHNVASVDVPLRSVVHQNPYTPGSVAAGGGSSRASGIAYNVGSTTSPGTWPASTGQDVGPISFLLRAA